MSKQSEEREQYQKLTKLQKSIVDSLKQIGFTWKYFSTYEKFGVGEIDVSRIDNLSELINKVFKLGSDQIMPWAAL